MGVENVRSYTNKRGETVTVSEDHLQTAVKIKLELQKASPSRKCSWSMLVKMMEEEGYDDAESSENYRVLIKSYQKSIGELPNVQKHADMVSDSKLHSIKELVGELYFEKREAQIYHTQINKAKRELVNFALLAEEITGVFRDLDYTQLQLSPYEEPTPSDRKMIVTLSDMHIGALVDLEKNKYNFNVAVSRMSQYATRIITEAKQNEVNDIYIMNLGDVIEHSSMRYNQGFNAEFAFADQIVMASDLIIKFITFLSEQNLNVTYAGIAGNHDRITEKDKNIDGDHVVKIINQAVKSFVMHSGKPNIFYDQAQDYKHSFEVNGKNVLALHGDLDSKNDANLLYKHSTLDGVTYDLVMMGHWHTVEVREVADGKILSVSGSLKGVDEYAENKLRRSSRASQSYFIIDEDGNIEVRWINLK